MTDRRTDRHVAVAKTKDSAYYIARVKRDDCNILPAYVFNAPPEEVPVGILLRYSGLEKTRIMPLPDRQKKCDDMLN